MQVKCAMCPVVFEARRRSARYCSPRCRTRAHRAGLTARGGPGPAAAAGDGPGDVEAATAAALAAAGRTETPAGQVGLALARRIDAGIDSGGGLASLVKQHRAALADAMAGEVDGWSPVDELRRRRERKAVADLFGYEDDADGR